MREMGNNTSLIIVGPLYNANLMLVLQLLAAKLLYYFIAFLLLTRRKSGPLPKYSHLIRHTV